MENFLLPREDPYKQISMEDSSYMGMRGFDTSHNRLSTDGFASHQSIG
jgi:hypothetical protein